MKNKFMKNLIVATFFVFAFTVANNAFAMVNDIPFYRPNYVNPSYATPNAYNTPGYYTDVTYNYNTSNSAYTPSYAQTEPYTYTEPTKIQYVYVPVQTSSNTSNTTTKTNVNNTQAASVARSNTNSSSSAKTVKMVSTAAGNGSGAYVNYDGVNPNLLGASAYGVYGTPYDNNGVTALTVRGNGGFMPSSIFQWVLVVLLIFAIVIVARMISKSYSKSVHAPAH